MPAANRVQQIAALAEQIVPLGQKTRGMRLAAEDWNQIVTILSALLKIDREQDEELESSLDATYSRIGHEHLGEVSLQWLDADLQSRLVSGGTGSAATQRALVDIRAEIAELRAEIALLRERADTPIFTGPLPDWKRFDAFETRLFSVENLAVTVSGIAKSQTVLDKNMQTVLDLGTKLESVTPGGKADPTLDTRLDSFSTQLEDKLSKANQTRIETLRDELLAADAKVADTLTVKIDKGLATSRDATLEAATGLVKAAETRLGASVTTQVGAAKTALAETLRDQADAAVRTGLAGVDSKIGGAVDQRVETLRGKLASDLDASVATKVEKAAAAIPSRVDQRVADAAAVLKLRLDSDAEQRAAALQQSLVPIIDQRVTSGIDAGLVQVRTASAQSVAAALGDLDTRIATSVKSATRVLPDQIAAQVKTEIGQANIAGQIAAANTATATQLRSEIAASAATVTTVNSTALNSAVTNLRGEIGSTAATRVAAPAVSPTIATIRNPRITPG